MITDVKGEIVAEVNDLAYYQNNPGEIPVDFASLDKLVLGETVAVQEEDVKPEVVETAPSETVEEEAKTIEVSEDTEAPIASKNGKHTLPYSVLAGEREKRQAAEKELQDLRAKLEGLEKVTTEAETGEDVDLGDIETEFPIVGKLTKALRSQVETLQRTVVDMHEREKSREEQQMKQVASSVQETIEAIPELLYWQQENPEMWAVAIQQAQVVGSNPKLDHLTMLERFKRVVKAVEAVYGETELPAKYRKEDDPAVVQEKAKKAVSQAKEFKPKTLSDMPGGSLPATDERASLENMSPRQLEQLLASKSPDEIQAYMARYG